MEYGLIGEHLPHSFSKVIHEKIADYSYELCELKPDEISDFLTKKNFKGINVTIPYKQDVIPYLDEISEQAKRIGAVNTIVNRDGKLYGYNTDYFGMKGLIQRLHIDLNQKKVLILGTGGTSKTALAVAEDLGAKYIYKVSRKKSEGVITYDEAYTMHSDADVLINTTPCGMFPNNDDCPISLEHFTNLCGVVDVIYNPLRTNLVLEAQKRMIPAEGGLHMLVGQAVAAAEFFLNTSYPKKLVDSVYYEILNSKRNLVLIGMSQCGKSTVGKIFAKQNHLKFTDTDQLIVLKENRPITEIFSQEGESYFRDLEHEVIESLKKENGLVISTGGGAALRDDNINALKQNGIVIFLDRPLDHLTPTEDRPLANSEEKIIQLFESRYPIYKSQCDVKIVNNQNADKAVQRIESVLNHKRKLLIINGPNLNMLGIREPDLYGYTTYQQLCKKIKEHGKKLDVEVTCYQSNHEGDLVDTIQSAYGDYDGIIINPGAYTHTSVAILDAVKAVSIPTIEVHISKVNEREEFRQVSYIRKACAATIVGHGIQGYMEAMDLLTEEILK